MNGVERQVAVKVIREGELCLPGNCHVKEATVHKNLSSSRRRQVHQRYYAIFECINDARDMTSYRSPNPLDTRTLDILYRIATGVSALHAANVLHRDLEPANVMLKGSLPFIIDYGRACSLNSFVAVTACKGFSRSSKLLCRQRYGPIVATLFRQTSVSLGVTFYVIVCREVPCPSDAKKDVVEAVKKLIIDPTNPPKTLVCSVPELTGLVIEMISKVSTERQSINRGKRKNSGAYYGSLKSKK